MITCYRCGQAGHHRNQCPTSRRFPPAHGSAAPGQWEPSAVLNQVPVRRAATPPTLAYLTARIEAGMPSAIAASGSPMQRACPWCGSSAWSPCRNPGTSRTTGTHQARKDAARKDQP